MERPPSECPLSGECSSNVLGHLDKLLKHLPAWTKRVDYPRVPRLLERVFT